MYKSKGLQHYFQIIPSETTVAFKQVNAQEMYNNTEGGFVRKVIAPIQKMYKPTSGIYKDQQFKIPQSTQYRLARLYDFYKQETQIFPEDEERSSFIQRQAFYNTFLSESGIISYDYLRTLFITQSINKQGYYQYFVKRNGEYFLQTCDDIIPIDRNKWMPLWNLSTGHPWQLVLFKVWLKQCGSFQNLYKAQPFKLLDAFGLSTYRLYNFRKQLNFIKNERLPLEKKKENQIQFAMNKQDVIIIAKTVDDPRIEKVGLVPNIVAYRLLRISKPDQEGLYRVYSSLPCHWVGSFTPILNTKLNKLYDKQWYLDLQRNFIMTEQQLLTYFNKFYVVPYQVSEPQRIITQDCINITSEKGRPNWIQFQVKSPQGMIALSIVLPKMRQNSKRYPQFRYFLSRRKNQQEMNRSHFRSDVRGAQREGNMYTSSSCDKWDCFGIDYLHGYHNTTTYYCKATQGSYVLYVDAEYNGPINVRIDSYVPISKPQVFHPSVTLIKQIFDSTFFSISQDLGIEASLNGETFQESISFNNSFEQLGFGSISVKTLTKAKHRIAMKIYPEKLHKQGYKLLPHYETVQNKSKQQNSLVFISAKGKPQIVILERIDKRAQSTIGDTFPPVGAIQFFRLQPIPSYNFKTS